MIESIRDTAYRVLFISGPSGIGKTSVGRVVAEIFGAPLFDLDQEIESECGLISDIVHTQGWAHFRNEEARVLRELITRAQEVGSHAIREMSNNGSLSPTMVISLGGGALLEPESLNLASTQGVILTLWGSAELIFTRHQERARREPLADRPLPLNPAKTVAVNQIQQLLSERYDLYRQCDLWLESFEGESVEQLAVRVIKAWRHHQDITINTRFYSPPSERVHSVLKRESQGNQDTKDGEQHSPQPLSAELSATQLGTYPIYFCSSNETELIKRIAAHCLGSLSHTTSLAQEDILLHLSETKIGIFSDAVVSSLHGAPLVGRLQSLGFNAHLISFPAGEQSKRLRVVEALVTRLLQLNFTRDDHLIAFGGGVTGDLCGFVASIYKRGISWSQIPTTLLSQVDSSIGAKTAVNHPLGKNLIGSFYRPDWVWIDEGYLETLPLRELRSGWVEAFKHGLIKDRSHAESLIEIARLHLVSNNRGEFAEISWLSLIKESISIKASIVSKDEHERNLRALLNLGHTLGHALESAHEDLNHGESVALGIVFTAEYSMSQSNLQEQEARLLITTLHELGFEVHWRKRLSSKVLSYLEHDKKRRGTTLSFVTLPSLGHAQLEELNSLLFIERFQELASSPMLPFLESSKS